MNIIKRPGNHGMYNKTRKIEYIVIHYTAGVTSKRGAAQATASWFASPRAGGTADFIVDDEEIVQYNPDLTKHACWAVGGGKYKTKGGRLYKKATNTNCVSIEICSTNSTGKVQAVNHQSWSFTAAAVNNAVELTKYLMKTYGIAADHVIRHYDVNGKPCPGIIGWNADSGSEKQWEAFKARLTQAAPAAAPSPAPTAPAAGAAEYKYEVTVSDLNIRKGPGTNYPSAGHTGKGTFTIIAESGGWGRLKSGAGWISLDSKYGHKVSGGNAPKAAGAAPSSEFRWTVTVPNLRIRKGPGTKYASTGKYTGKGTFTITKRQNGWGYLKSGAGWISLNTSYGHRA